MAKDIVFVSPSFKPILQEESIGTLILAKKVILNGFSIAIVRYWECDGLESNDYNLFCKSLINKILKQQPRIVSFYCRCTDYHISIDISRRIKKICKDVIIVFGGPQAELVAKDTLRFFSFIDFVACSEGENTIIPLLNLLINKRSTSDTVPGLTFRANNNIIQNIFPKYLPNYYTRNYLYYDLIPSSIIASSKSLTVDVGRGCPYSCTFCSTKTFWQRQFRLRDINDVISEVEWVITNFGINKFDFDHDLFTVNKTKLREFCMAIKTRGLNLKWYCSSRLDTISEEDIDYMADAGMTNILFGVESGSTRMQKIINKNLNLETSKKIVAYAVSKGVKTKMSFMYGFPEETIEDFEQTLRLMYEFQRMGAHVVFWRCGILNGTALYNKHKDELYLDEENYKNFSFFGYPDNIELIKEYKSIFPQFYDHPNPLRKQLLYFDLYFSLWRDFAREEFDKIANDFLSNDQGLFGMYLSFVRSNDQFLGKIKPQSLDKFWNLDKRECQSLVDRFKSSIQPKKS